MQQNTGANNIVATTQNGYKPGDLVSYQINDDGTVVGNYSNEQNTTAGADCTGELCQQRRSGIRRRQRLICDAIFWRGAVGDSRDGQLWHLTNGALEASNVDLSKELVNMIVAQRNYQSNAQTIKTRDQILNTLVNLR